MVDTPLILKRREYVDVVFLDIGFCFMLYIDLFEFFDDHVLFFSFILSIFCCCCRSLLKHYCVIRIEVKIEERAKAGLGRNSIMPRN